MKTTRQNLRYSQTGLVSIMVTVIVMLVITLIVLGFARIVRREQRQSLDDQLSTQAFYAAEAGVNDAVNAIKNNNYTNDKTNCTPDAAPPLDNASSQLNGANVSYTCLLIDQSPSELAYDNIATGNSTVIPVTAANGAAINTITLSWQENTNPPPATFLASGCDTTRGFPANGSWPANCNAGVLRLDLVGGPIDRSSLVTNTMTAFLYPQAGSAAVTVGYATSKGFDTTGTNGQGKVVGSDCRTGSGKKFCTVTITGLSLNTYYLRLKSIYKPNTVTINATTTGGAATDLIGAQLVIDSTGKAQDVLRRIKVSVPVSNPGSVSRFPDFALESVKTICKRLKVIPGTSVTFDSYPADAAACDPTQ